ncbi:MAG: hypothetical protein JXA04_03615 [Gammaproteobacteria bacterium]|nr:hypothetical protein [Gammaproteobacteria bacterium]
MLEEVLINSKPEPDERRWFSSARADLYVWWNKSGDIDRFEYCHKIGPAEYSLRWHTHSGIEYALVDDGEATPLKNNTPIAVMSGEPDWDDVLAHFRREGQTIDAYLYRFVLHKLLKAAFAA